MFSTVTNSCERWSTFDFGTCTGELEDDDDIDDEDPDAEREVSPGDLQ